MDVHAGELSDLLNRREKLNPTLKRYLEHGDSFSKLRHPLVYSVPYFPQLNAMLNAQLRTKKRYLKEALKNDDVDAYIFLHERPYRVEAFQKWDSMQGAWRLSNKKYWATLSYIWRDSENIWQNRLFWTTHLFGSSRAGSDYFMEEEDRAHFLSLPDILTVYRGCKEHNRDGFSWTLDRDRAEFFAKRFEKTSALLLTAKVAKADVFAYTNLRNEQEIILSPETLARLEISEEAGIGQ